MPIQDEKKVAAFLVPETPKDQSELIKWAQETNKVLNQINRQFVSFYNLHLDNPYAHPKAWGVWRIQRPYYKFNSSTQVIFPASTTQPINFVIGQNPYQITFQTESQTPGPKLFQATSSLILDTTVSGPGGLRAGLTVATGTAYYIYAINNGGTVAMLGDTNDPTVGPSGFSAWSYMGAFATVGGGPTTILPFVSTNGFYLSEREINTQSLTGTTTRTAKTYTNMPTTTRFAHFQTTYSGTVANATGTIGASNNTDDSLATVLQVASTNNYFWGWMPILTAQTIWLTTSSASNTIAPELYGWMENPMEFP